MAQQNRYRGHQHKRPQRADNYQPPYEESILSMNIEGLKLQPETVELLNKGGINIVGDIVKRRAQEMYRVQNFNKRKLLEVKGVLDSLGVDFRPEEVKNLGANENQSQVSAQNVGNVPNQRSTGIRNDRNVRAGQSEPMRQNRIGAQNSNVNNSLDSGRRRAEQSQNQDRAGKSAVGSTPDKRQNGKKQKEDNSYSTLRIFPKEPFRRTPRIEMPKDSYVKFQKAGKWGFKDTAGREVIPPIYTEVCGFKEDIACVEMNGLFGYIDRKNNLIIPYKYECAGNFSEGLANVMLNERCGYIDTQGNEVVPFIYDAATAFVDGTGRVKKEGRWGNLNKSGEVSWQ